RDPEPVAGTQMLVDRNAAVLLEHHAPYEFGGRTHADAEQDEIRGETRAAVEDDLADSPVALEARDGRAKLEADPVLLVQRPEHGPDLGAERPLERDRIRRYDRHGEPALREA